MTSDPSTMHAASAPLFAGAILVDAAMIRAACPWPLLIARIEAAFRRGAQVPQRHHHTIEHGAGEPAGTLLLMPAWRPGEVVGVKVLQVAPGNAARGEPAVHSLYILSDARTGKPLALLDGAELTARRTAAASALAAAYLARASVSRLLIVGTGRLAPNLAAAHATVRSYSSITVWGRRADAAQAMAARIRAETGIETGVAANLEDAVREADVISCATLSREPLVHGAWLQPGTHLDLVGAFTPAMRETDAAAMAVGSVWVDTLAGACAEGGDIVQAIAAGVLSRADIRGALSGLDAGVIPRRDHDDEITVFKSV
ncbi:MAG: ornithine cyclodeaminase family protein, partial [Burkholderiales bacterium]|nr:ornithine cyclodeaminase family protein [Burkholderiales bacterium]